MGHTLPSCSVAGPYVLGIPKAGRECPEQPAMFVHQATEKGTVHFTDPCFAGIEQA